MYKQKCGPPALTLVARMRASWSGRCA